MQIFLDSADPEQVRLAQSWGRIEGITTNPSSVASLGRSYSEIIHELLTLSNGPVSLEVIATDLHGILQQARALARLSYKVVVKVPCTSDGLQAVTQLSKENIKTNVTLVCSLSQAMLAAQAGATYCSVFVGRLEDVAEHSADELLAQVRTVYDEQHFQTKLLAASIRNEAHVEKAMIEGADIVTIPFHVLERMIRHQLTEIGLQKFLDDWARAGLDFPA